MTKFSKQDIQERIEGIINKVIPTVKNSTDQWELWYIDNKGPDFWDQEDKKLMKNDFKDLISDVVKAVIGENEESKTYFGISDENTKTLEQGKLMDNIRNKLRSEQEAKRKELLGD